MFSWFLQKGVRQGVFWAILIYLTSSLNDVLQKLLGDRLHFIEIAFFRYFFSVVVVIFPIFFSNGNLLQSRMHGMHAVRGIMGAVALALCCFSVNVMPLAENTTILFSESLFMLPLAAYFLGEKISQKSWIATTIGFIGLFIMYKPSASNINMMAIIPTAAAFLFAIMNIIIKKMIDRKENQLTMLFYFGLYTTAISGVFVPFFWKTPNMREMFLISLLGVGANLIQLFIFLAYRATTTSTISPIRYIELPFAIAFGMAFFAQIPEVTAIVGGGLIVIGTFISSMSKK